MDQLKKLTFFLIYTDLMGYNFRFRAHD